MGTSLPLGTVAQWALNTHVDNFSSRSRAQGGGRGERESSPGKEQKPEGQASRRTAHVSRAGEMKTELVNSDSQSLLLDLAARELGSNVGERCIGLTCLKPASAPRDLCLCRIWPLGDMGGRGELTGL